MQILQELDRIELARRYLRMIGRGRSGDSDRLRPEFQDD